MKSIDKFFEEVVNKSILVVFPHPDDESVMAGGIIQRAMTCGFAVTVLTLTEGNRGKIHINGKGRSVSEIRREEMSSAMSRLGVVDWVMWKFEDGKLRKRNNWRIRLGIFVKETKPGVVVTYDLSGVTGHPDHISLSQEILKFFKEKQSFRLLWVSFVSDTKKRMVNSQYDKYLVYPKYELDLSFVETLKKWRASFAHKSQKLLNYLKLPWWVLVFTSRREWYSLADKNQIYKYKFAKFKI